MYNKFDVKVSEPEFPENKFNIKEFGGVADGNFDNTEVFARAMSACRQAGEETIVVPEGRMVYRPHSF